MKILNHKRSFNILSILINDILYITIFQQLCFSEIISKSVLIASNSITHPVKFKLGQFHIATYSNEPKFKMVNDVTMYSNFNQLAVSLDF